MKCRWSWAFATLAAVAVVCAADAADAPKPSEDAKPKTSSAAPRLQVGDARFIVFKTVKQEAYDAALTLTPKDPGARLESADLLIAARDADNAYRLRYEKGGLTLRLRLDGVETTLASAEVPAPAPGEGSRFTVRRRRSWIAVRVDDHEVLRVADPTFAAGGFGIAENAQPVRLGKWSLRPFAPIDLRDDFMRTDEDKDPWESLSGSWRLHTVRQSETLHPARGSRAVEPSRSANYFSYEGRTNSVDEAALCVIGEPDWSDCRAAVSARPGGGWIGVAVGVRDARNYTVLRWRLDTLRPRPSPVEMLRVTDGKPRVLGRALAPGAVSQWYRLSLDASGDRLVGRLDETVVLDLAAPGCGEGRVGFYAAGPQGALFDDVAVRGLDALRFDTEPSFATVERVGPWKRFRERARSGSPDETRRIGWTRSTEEPVIVRLARTGWRRCALQAEVALPATGSRVVLDLAGKQRSLALECRRAGDGKGEATLNLTENGECRRLAKQTFDLAANASAEFRLEATSKDAVRAYADGRLLFRVDAALVDPARPVIQIDGPGDIRVSNAQVLFDSERDAGRKVRQRFFAHDPYMVGWAADTGAWVRPKEQGGVYWHKSDFHGPFRVKFAPVAGLILYLKARGEDPASGYVARVVKVEDALKLDVLRSGKTVAQSAVPAGAEGLELAWEAGELGARCGDRRLFSLREPDPPDGCRIALRAAMKALGKVEVTQFNVKDYIFTKAPTDWTTSGLWEITNRFACDPRWSWLSATCWDGVAAGWNKYEFMGDMTVEFYAGMRMQRNRRRSYPRPGEINATLCADGRDLNTGYSVIINGWDPEWSGQWSRVLRGDREVACARRELVPCNRMSNPSRRVIPIPWDPGGRPIHGAWYYVKIRKLGGRIEVYFDNVLVMAYEDPAPLSGRRVAVWTMDNSIMIARVRVSYAHCRKAPLPVAATENAPEPPSSAAAESRPLVRSVTHPGAVCSFEDGLDGWVNPDGDQGADLSLAPAPHGGRCMKLVNIASGGTFAARLSLPDFDLLRATRLSFRYRASPGVRVNLYFPVRTGAAFVRLTGPDEANANLVRLGAIADARADGRWRTAVFDLARAARKAFPDDTRLPCREARIAYDHPGYGRAGIRGNGQDATLLIDDFRIGSLGEPHAVFELAAPGGASRATLSGPEYAYVVSDDEPAPPPGEANGRDTVLTVDCPRSGLHYLNVRTRASADAAWSGAMSYPFWVDKAPLRVRSVTPDPKTRDGGWGGEPVRVAFEPCVAAIDPSSAALTVNDVRVWGAGKALETDWDRRTVTLDLARSSFTFKDGQTVKLGLTLGKRLGDRQTFAWTYRYRRNLDKAPPSPPILKDVPLDLDFRRGLEDVSATSTAFTSLSTTPKGALRLSNLVLGGNLSVRLFSGAAHVGRNPLLVFDYRMPPFLSVDWLVVLGGQSRPLKFTDTSPGKPRHGFVPGIVADNRWRRAEVDLRRFAEALPVKDKSYSLGGLYVADGGHCANAPGATFELARPRLVPLRSAAQGFDLNWSASDPSGIAGYAYSWSRKADAVPEPKIMTREGRARFEGLPDGRLYFHLRAVDNAGNWGETRSRVFLIDNTAPAYRSASAEVRADEVLEVGYRDRLGGVDASSILCRLDEPALTAERAHTEYDYRRNVHSWRWVEQAPARMGAVPDGTVRVFHLSSCLDFAGNASAPRELRMTIRHAGDKTGPPAPVVRLSGHKMLTRRTYETGASLEPWGHRSHTRLARVRRRRGDRCLRVQPLTYRHKFGVYLHGPDSRPYDPEEHPWVCFDYRIAKKTRLALLINVSGRRFAVDMTGGPRRGCRLLRARGLKFKADGEWRHAALNLGELIRDQGGMRRDARVRWLAVTRDAPGRQGGEFWLDNVTIIGPVRRLPGVRAKARDLTGVRGFVCAVDSRPDAEPEKPEIPTDRWSVTDAPAGLSYIHIRARDGAGNLGRTAHVPLVYEPPPPAPEAPAQVAPAARP